MNQSCLVGRLTKDAELSYTQTGKAVASFTLAVVTPFYDTKTNEKKENTAFINCVAWGELGEYAAAFVKGQKIFCKGRLQTRSYEGRDGVKRYVTEVVAEFIAGNPTQKVSSNFDSMAATNNNEEIPF